MLKMKISTMYKKILKRKKKEKERKRKPTSVPSYATGDKKKKATA